MRYVNKNQFLSRWSLALQCGQQPDLESILCEAKKLRMEGVLSKNEQGRMKAQFKDWKENQCQKRRSQ